MKDYVFRMKQFEIRHTHSAMKVGTDSLLLGAWCPLSGSETRVLDIGSGCGILSLMVAQRLPQALITGVELDEASYMESLTNISQSKWHDRMTMIHGDINSFVTSDAFDLILCNPPYFNSLRPASDSRTRARHQQSLRPEDLFLATYRLLSQTGICSIIIPFDQATSYMQQAEHFNLCPRQMVTVRHNANMAPKRMLFAFGKGRHHVSRGELTIGDPESRSEAYRTLLAPFLLSL